MSKQLFLSIFVLLVSTDLIIAQTNLRPSTRYESGEAIIAGTVGLQTVIPEGWSGMLPRDNELFLLLPNEALDGEIYIYAGPAVSPEQRKDNWLTGLDLGNGNVLKSDGNIFTRGSAMASKLVLSENTSYKTAYIEALCGPYNWCITATIIGAPDGFDKMQKALYEFMDAIIWLEPREGGMYGDFNWHEFLAGKHLLNHNYVPSAKMENDIWLCSDGTFTTKLKRGGSLKDQAQEYKGTNKGTWETTSVGQKGILILNYEKLPPLKVNLEIKDEQIYLNDRRHFAMRAGVCE